MNDDLNKEIKQAVKQAVDAAFDKALGLTLAVKIFEKNLFQIRVIREEKDKIFVFDSAVYDYCLCPDFAKYHGWKHPVQGFENKTYEDLLLSYEEYKKRPEIEKRDFMKNIAAGLLSSPGVCTDADVVEALIFKYVHKKFPNKRVIFGNKTWEWKEINLQTEGRHQGIFVQKYQGKIPKISDIKDAELIFIFNRDFEENKKIFDEELVSVPRLPVTFGLG